jgi:hypothetical protein
VTSIRLKYVHSFNDRYGKARFYFRRNGERIALPGLPGSSEFMDAYASALDRASVPAQIGAWRIGAGTIGAAVLGYFGSAEFQSRRRSNNIGASSNGWPASTGKSASRS